MREKKKLSASLIGIRIENGEIKSSIHQNTIDDSCQEWSCRVAEVLKVKKWTTDDDVFEGQPPLSPPPPRRDMMDRGKKKAEPSANVLMEDVPTKLDFSITSIVYATIKQRFFSHIYYTYNENHEYPSSVNESLLESPLAPSEVTVHYPRPYANIRATNTFNLNFLVFPLIPRSHLQLLSFAPTLIPSSTSTFSQFHTSSEQFVRSCPRIQALVIDELLIYEAGGNELDKKNKEDNKKTKNSPKSKDAKSLTESHFEMDSRLLTALLIGVNRAFPFVSSNDADDIIEVLTPMLFHLSTLALSEVPVQYPRPYANIRATNVGIKTCGMVEVVNFLGFDG
ncbi:hypothetical protein LguiA_002015 [Lonicera macranthoides]